MQITDVLRVLDEKPDAAKVLAEAARLEAGYLSREAVGETVLGFQWQDVHAHPSLLNRLVTEGILNLPYSSRSSKNYRLAISIEEAEQAVALVSQGRTAGPTSEGDEPPPDFLQVIEGHEEKKERVLQAVGSSRPVHLLFVGTVASGKSLFMDELQRLPDSHYGVAATTSNAGLVDYLLSSPCRYLLIEEIDKVPARDLSVLLPLMENGFVGRLVHGRVEGARRPVWVFATANDERKLPDPLRSRFVPVRFEPYTATEYRNVCNRILVMREGCDPELASEVAQATATAGCRDPRRAVQIARLCGGDRRLIGSLVEQILG